MVNEGYFGEGDGKSGGYKWESIWAACCFFVCISQYIETQQLVAFSKDSREDSNGSKRPEHSFILPWYGWWSDPPSAICALRRFKYFGICADAD